MGLFLFKESPCVRVIQTSKISVDTIAFHYDSNKEIVTTSYDSSTRDEIIVSNVTWSTKDKQKVLDALEKKANIVIEKKTEGGTEKIYYS